MQYVVHKPRIGLFIDTQNLYHSARDLMERTVNFETILNVARADRELVHAIAYTVEKENEGTARPFIYKLSALGYKVRRMNLTLHHVAEGGRPIYEGNWDMGMVADMFRLIDHLDIMVLGAQRPTVMVGKTELQGWPLIGSITTRGGTFFLDRSSKISAASVAEKIAQAVDAGIFFLFFPEGTSSEGTKILPFHSPLFQPIVEAEAPIYPAHLTYLLPSEEGGKEAVGTKVCYWGDASIVTHLPRLLGLRGLHCSLRIGADAILAGDRKSAAMQSRIAVEKLFAASLQQAASVEHLQHLLHTPIERVGPLNGEGSVLARR